MAKQEYTTIRKSLISRSCMRRITMRNYHFVVTTTGLVCMPYTLQHLTELLHPTETISYPKYSILMEDSTTGSHELVNIYLHDSLVLTEQGNAVEVSFQSHNLLACHLYVVLIRIKIWFLCYNEGWEMSHKKSEKLLLLTYVMMLLRYRIISDTEILTLFLSK